MTDKPRRTRDEAGRSGGINISGNSRVDVKGDMVGRDKVVGADPDLQQLFERLAAAIQTTTAETPRERKQLVEASDELKSELSQPTPDLGKIDRLKRVLAAHGGQIAEVTSAIF